jgi:hypothetical protein
LDWSPYAFLRWVLRIDYFLPTIGRAADLSYAVAHEIVVNARTALGTGKMIDLDSLATAHRAAEDYFYRCAAETISRGYHESDDELVKEWAHVVSETLAGKQGEDLLLGPGWFLRRIHRALAGSGAGTDSDDVPCLDKSPADRF